MPSTFRDAEGNLHTANTAEQAAAFSARGWTQVNLVRREDFEGNATVVATEEAPTLEQDLLASTPEAAEVAANRQRTEEVTREANTVGEQVGAGLSSLASGLTGGLTEFAGLSSRAGLSDENRDILRSQTGVAETIGLVGSAISPLGAEAGIARAARSVFTRSSWGSTIGRLALEGAGGGVLAASAETAASGEDLSSFAERVGGDALVGAMFGGALGVPLGGVGAVARRVRGRGNALSRASEEVTQEAALTASRTDGRLAGEFLRPEAPTSVAGRIGEAISGSRAIDPRNPMVRRGIQLSDDFGNLSPLGREQVAGRLQNVITRVDEAVAELGTVRRLNYAGMADDAAEFVTGSIEDSRAALRSLDVGQGTRAAQLIRKLNEVALPSGTAGELASSTLTYRDTIDEFIRSAGGMDSPDLARIAPELRNLREGVTQSLSADIWGEATDQLSRRTTTLDSLRNAQRSVLKTFRRGGDALDDLGSTDISRSRRAMENAVNSGDLHAFRQMVDLSEMMDNLGDTLPEAMPRAKVTSGLRDDLDMLSAAAQDRANRIRGAENEAGAQAARQVLGGAGIGLGLLTGGGAGAGIALASGALGAARGSYTISRMAARLANAFGKQGNKVAQSATRVRATLRSTSFSPFVSRMRVAGGTIAATFVGKDQKARRETYEELANRVELLSNHPATLAQSLNGALPGSETLDSRLPTFIGMQISNQMAVLAAALPRGRRNTSTSPNVVNRGRGPSNAEIQEFLEVASVIEDPTFSLELMAAGRLSERGARSVQQAFPHFHQAMSQQILGDFARARIEGSPINYQASLMASRFLGYPVDATMEPGFNAAVTSQSAQTPGQEQAQFSTPRSTRNPDSIAQSMTPLDRVSA